MSHVFGVFLLDLVFSYAAPLATSTSCTGKAIKSRIMNILVSLKSLNGQRPVMEWSKGGRWHHNIGRLPPGLILKNLWLTKSETFSAELGGPLLWDIPIYVWHSCISSLGIPVSHRALVQRLTTKGVSLDGNFQLCSGSYSKSRTFSFADTKRLAYPSIQVLEPLPTCKQALSKAPMIAAPNILYYN